MQLWLSCSCASTRVGGDCSPPLILRGSLYFPSPGFLPGHWSWLGLCTGAAWKWAWGSQHPSGWPYPGSDGRPWVNALALSRGVFWCSSAPCRAQAIALACDFENALFPKLSIPPYFPPPDVGKGQACLCLCPSFCKSLVIGFLSR